MLLQGEHIGNTQHLSLTGPARGCHTDVQGHVQGNIHLAALGWTCGGGPECRVQVVQRTAFPAHPAEELEDVRVPGTTAFPACLQTLCSVVLCTLMPGSLHKQALLQMHEQQRAPALLTATALLTEIEGVF